MNNNRIRLFVDILLWLAVLVICWIYIFNAGTTVAIKLTVATVLLLSAYWTTRVLYYRRNNLEAQRQLEDESRELRFQRDRHMAFFALTHDGIIVLDKNNNILRINDAITDITGYSVAETVGKPCATVFRVEKYKETGLTFGLGYLTDEAPTHYEEVSLLTKDGNHIDIGVRCTRAKKFPGHRGTSLILIRDLSKIHEAESMEHDFISMTSHQLFTPLSIIRGHIALLLQGDLGKITPKQHEFLNQTLESTRKMVNLVTDLLSVSRLEEKKIVLNFASTNLTTIINDTVRELKTLADARRIKIDVDLGEKKIPELNIDGEKVTQVLQNLIDNAIKYTNPTGHILIKAETRPNDVLVSVTDNGVGIPATDLPKLFQRFYRSTNIMSMDQKGTGLGLYIAKIIITRHQGKIWAESAENKGSTFYFTLPK